MAQPLAAALDRWPIVVDLAMISGGTTTTVHHFPSSDSLANRQKSPFDGCDVQLGRFRWVIPLNSLWRVLLNRSTPRGSGMTFGVDMHIPSVHSLQMYKQLVAPLHERFRR